MEIQTNPKPVAQQALLSKHFGALFINIPFVYKGTTLSCALLLTILAIGLSQVNLSSHIVVPGYVDAVPGVIRIMPLKAGIITKKYVNQGDKVSAGQPLFKLQPQHEIKLPSEALKQYQSQIDADIQQKKSALARLRPLLAKKYISQTTIDEHIQSLRQLQHTKLKLMESLQHQARDNEIVIRAPIAGEVATVTVEQGAVVSQDKPLLKLLPQDAKLVVQLMIPAQHIGLIEQDSDVSIHFDTYPYQRFGSGKAKLSSISQTMQFTEEEHAGPLKLKQGYYKGYAQLLQTCITYNGKRYALKHGMSLQAFLVTEKKSVLRWLLGRMTKVDRV